MESQSYGRFCGIISSVFVPAKFLYFCCLLGILIATIGLDCQRDFVRDIFVVTLWSRVCGLHHVITLKRLFNES